MTTDTLAQANSLQKEINIVTDCLVQANDYLAYVINIGDKTIRISTETDLQKSIHDLITQSLQAYNETLQKQFEAL